MVHNSNTVEASQVSGHIKSIFLWEKPTCTCRISLILTFDSTSLALCNINDILLVVVYN